jgi:hypothetical protein
MRTQRMLVEGVNYDINWRAFRKGTSIFIPCLDPKEAKRTISCVCVRLRINILTKVVICEGIRGLRIWRR